MCVWQHTTSTLSLPCSATGMQCGVAPGPPGVPPRPPRHMKNCEKWTKTHQEQAKCAKICMSTKLGTPQPGCIQRGNPRGNQQPSWVSTAWLVTALGPRKCCWLGCALASQTSSWDTTGHLQWQHSSALSLALPLQSAGLATKGYSQASTANLAILSEGPLHWSQSGGAANQPRTVGQLAP